MGEGSSPAYVARVASVVASTAIALACGTNYAYSAWGPEFAERMAFSATESNVIGVAANMGMYAMGIPAGLLVDKKGPKWGVLAGGIALACGYFPIHRAYINGPGSMSLQMISLCSFLTGTGSCTAFSAAVKTSTFNFPEGRGTASAFPLSGFGLSAFFFSALGNLAFSEKAGDFLLMLAIGTLALNILALPFMNLIRPSHDYTAVPDHEDRPTYQHAPNSREPLKYQKTPQDQREITGLALLKHVEFYRMFAIMGLLAGVGLMTINNIGNNTKALWLRYDPSRTPDFIQAREQMHVSVLSVGSFTGRFISGTGSDFIVKRLRASRFWCLVLSASVFALAQTLALFMSNPDLLFLVSSLTGVGYGFLFGVFPAIVADAFGVQGMSLNWGFFIAAPVISGNVYNLSYGAIYDAHSHHGKGECREGLDCYRGAYWMTLASSIAGGLMALYYIRHARM